MRDVSELVPTQRAERVIHHRSVDRRSQRVRIKRYTGLRRRHPHIDRRVVSHVMHNNTGHRIIVWAVIDQLSARGRTRRWVDANVWRTRIDWWTYDGNGSGHWSGWWRRQHRYACAVVMLWMMASARHTIFRTATGADFAGLVNSNNKLALSWNRSRSLRRIRLHRMQISSNLHLHFDNYPKISLITRGLSI